MGDALSAHREALRFGGLPGIHDLRLVDSAIARPYCGYYPRIAQKAAALVQSVAMNHGFTDGNKRTTLILLNLFLSKSGYELAPANPTRSNQEIETMILAVVRRQLGFADLVQWFERRLKRRPPQS